MKRADLVPGQDYYFARGGDWENGEGWGDERVTVVSTENVSKDHSYGWSRARANTFVLYDGREVHVHAQPGGSGILVQDVSTGRIHVVQPGQIRGSWAETKARVDAAKAELERERQARRQARVEREIERQRLAGRIERLGLNPGELENRASGVVVPRDTLAALVEIAERAGEV